MHSVHLQSLDLNLLLVLRAVLKERSVTRAAKSLGLSPSATSHALSRLREVLGDPLVVRTGRGLSVTPRAEAMSQKLDAALASLEAVIAPPEQFSAASSSHRFRVASADYAELVLLPPLAARLSSVAQGVGIWTTSAASDTVDELRRGDVDVVIGVGQANTPPDVHARDLWDERFVCLVRDGHALLRGKVTPERFARARHAFIAPRGKPGGIVDSVLEGLGLAREVAVAVPHFLVAPHIVAETDLVLTVPERIARRFTGILPVRVFESPIALPGFTLRMFWHDRTHRDPAHLWFRGEVAEVAARAGAVRRLRRTSGRA